MDRETVITHLQIIHTWAEFARDCDLQFFTAKHLEDIAKWSDDAIDLLKRRKAEIENLKQTAQSMMEGVCLLKEQEAVKPKSKVRYSEDIMDSLVNLMTEFLKDHEIYMLMELVASAVATK